MSHTQLFNHSDVEDQKPPNWADVYGPWILSFCVHIVLFCVIFWHISEKPELPIRHIRLSFAQPGTALTPAPGPVSASPAQPLWSRANQQVVPEKAREDAKEIASLAPKDAISTAQPVATGDASPGAEAAKSESSLREDQNARVQRILASYGKSAEEGRKSLGEGQKDLQGRLETAGLRVASYPHFGNFGGARVGAIRTLSFDKVSPEVSKEVMARYDIRITSKFVSQTGPSYLNSAASGGSVYLPGNKPGYYEVFEISPKAYRQMVVLEQNWLVSHGCDPSSTYADTVEFGIVQTSPGQWDLGITRMEVRQLAEIGNPGQTPLVAARPTP